VENKILTKPTMLIATITIATLFVAIPLVSVSAVSSATVAVSPGSINTDFGGSFTANVVLTGGSNIIGYDVKLTFNPDVLQVTSASLAGTLLDPATNNVIVARHEVFNSIGFVRYAVVGLGGVNQSPNPSASLLTLNFQVSDPTVAGSTATASEYPSSISISGAEVVAMGAVTVPVTTSDATYMPPAFIALRSVGCRANNNGFNTNAKGFTDPLFCRIINNGSTTVTARGDFNYASLGGLTGSLSGPTINLGPGQAAQVDSALTVAPHTNDIFFVTGQGSRVISFQDGSVLAIPGGSVVFQVTVISPF
jgi:Cohesin domain